MTNPWDHYQPAGNLLAKRVILVTGAAHGLGRMAAYTYARYGATVILLDQDEKALELLYDQIVEKDFPEPVLICNDLCNFEIEQADSIAQQTMTQLGRLDGLLHSAGMLGMLGPIEYMDPKLWQQTVQVNLHAAFLLIRVFTPLLKQSPDASILLTSMAPQWLSKAYWSACAVAAAGVDALSQIVADELESESNLRINTLDPGDVNTRWFQHAFPGRELDHVVTPDSLKWAYLYLMGPDSRGISGHKLTLQSE